MGICRVIGFPPHGSHSHLFEDAMQGFNLRLLENNRRALLSFRGQADFQARAFLRKVAASVAANVLRSQPPASGSLEDRIFFKNEERFTRSETIADQSSAYEDFILLRGAIEYCLDKILHGQHKFRNILIFKLAVYDGFSAEELAAMPGLNMRSTHAVEQLLSRIRKKLLAYLESQ
jgi:DNA-directed RNA polymerase specialized sigma24 family protein